MDETIGRRGTSGLWILGSPYSLGVLLAAGLTLVSVASSSSLLRFSSLSSFVIFLSIRAVGSLLILRYTGVSKCTRIFSSYCSSSITTVALPLSAGKITTPSSSLSDFKALHCCFDILALGGLASLRMLHTFPLSSLASPVGSFRAPSSTAAAISMYGIFRGAGAKLKVWTLSRLC